jgi:lambda family phage portal protein
LMRSAYDSFFTSGECLGASVWKESTNGQRTCMYLMDPERLSDPRGQQDYMHGRRMGVERDQHGAPIGYHIRSRHPNDNAYWGPPDQLKWKYYKRRTGWGRWNIFHYFEQDRPDMTRGISSYTTAALPMRMLQDYMMTELESAAVRATYAAVIQSKLNYEDAMRVIGPEYANAVGGNPILDFTLRLMTDRAQFYNGQDLRFGKAKVSHLLPDEELKMIQGAQHANGLSEYAAQNLYLIASGLGVDYASLTKDYSSTNYSGARAALYDVWRSYEVRRDGFMDSFAWPFFTNWLEEMVALRGEIPMLGSQSFYDVKDALAYGTFETWAKPRLDPLKETQADILLYKTGALSLRDLAKTEGRNWQQVLKYRAQEKAEMDKLGLKPEDIDPELLMNAGADNQEGSGSSSSSK